MPYEIHSAPGEAPAHVPAFSRQSDEGWPMWEVFVRPRRGLAHGHAGSLHAPDAETALQHARDVYTRRREGVSVWVVPSSAITASDPDDTEEMFESIEKPYRHATYYEIPEEVGHM
jgi:ring-1,2-phenylacetyl-CoA epoxidase subunit PaaB